MADNYAPFYRLPIECTDRDAAFVLDGLLYNESELEIEEHYSVKNRSFVSSPFEELDWAPEQPSGKRVRQ